MGASMHLADSSALRVVVVGAGFMGTKHLRALEACDLTKAVAIVDPSPATRSVASDHGVDYYPSVETLLTSDTSVDAAIVAVPDRHHVPAATELLNAHVPTLLEKPLAHDYSSARAIVDAAESTRTPLMIGHILRFEAQYVQAAQEIQSGGIGSPLHFSAYRFAPRSLGSNLRQTTSPLFYMGIHDVDLANWFIGAEVTRVYAAPIHERQPPSDPDNPDGIFSTVEFANGAVAHLGTAWTLPTGTSADVNAFCQLVGTEGSIEIDCRRSGLQITAAQQMATPDVSHWPTLAEDRLGGALLEEVRHFASALKGSRDFLVPTASALEAVRITDAIRNSIRTSQPVHLND